MENKEKMLTLLREKIGREIARHDRVVSLYGQIAAHERKREIRDCLRLWDAVDREIAEEEKDDAQLGERLKQLYASTSAGEFTASEHLEMRTLRAISLELADDLLEQAKELWKRG